MPTPSSLHRAAAWPSTFTPSRHTAPALDAMRQTVIPPITPPDVSITMLDLEQAFRADMDVAVFGPTTGTMTSALTLDRLTEVSRMLDAHHDNGAARLRTAVAGAAAKSMGGPEPRISASVEHVICGTNDRNPTRVCRWTVKRAVRRPFGGASPIIFAAQSTAANDRSDTGRSRRVRSAGRSAVAQHGLYMGRRHVA